VTAATYIATHGATSAAGSAVAELLSGGSQARLPPTL